jgi:hypothetical protein
MWVSKEIRNSGAFNITHIRVIIGEFTPQALIHTDSMSKSIDLAESFRVIRTF